MATYIWVNIGSGNDLLLSVLIYDQVYSVLFTQEQFHKICSWN